MNTRPGNAFLRLSQRNNDLHKSLQMSYYFVRSPPNDASFHQVSVVYNS